MEKKYFLAVKDNYLYVAYAFIHRGHIEIPTSCRVLKDVPDYILFPDRTNASEFYKSIRDLGNRKAQEKLMRMFSVHIGRSWSWAEHGTDKTYRPPSSGIVRRVQWI